MVSSWDLYLTYICRDSISKLEHTHKYQSWGSGHVFWGPLFNSLKPCVQVSFQKAPVPFWKGTASSSPGIFLLVFQTRCRDSTKLFVGAGMIGFHFSHILWRHGNLWMLPLFSWPCLLDLTFHDLQKRHPPLQLSHQFVPSPTVLIQNVPIPNRRMLEDCLTFTNILDALH